MIHVDEAQVCLQQAQTYWQAKNWQLTIETCAKALAIDQKLTDAHKLMGDALQRVGNTKEAIGYYVQAIAYKPDFVEVYANLGALYAREKQWDRAVVHYQKAIAIKPEFTAIYHQLAKVYQIQEKSAQAEACLAQAKAMETKESKPKVVSNITTRANSEPSLAQYLLQAENLKQQGELEAALQIYRKAAAIEPQRVSTYKEIVSLCEQLSMWAEAAKYCRLILQLNNSTELDSPSSSVVPTIVPSTQPSYSQNQATQSHTSQAEYHYNLGTIHAEKQEWSAAIQQYQKAITIDPQMVKAHLNLGRALSQLGDKQQSTEAWLKAATLENQALSASEYVELAQNLASWGKVDSAVSCYRRATERQPDLAVAYLGWGELLVQEKLGEEAIACYLQGLKYVQDGELYYRLGCLYRAKEEWTKATLCYQKANNYSPENSAAYHELGEVLSQQEQWHEAIAAYRQAVKLNPEFSWSYNNLGYALIQLGQWSEAIPVYHEAIRLNPEFPWSYHNLAEAYSKENRWNEAVDFFQRAAKIQPDLPHVQQKLGDALYRRSLQDRDLALKHFNLAIQQEPDEPFAYQQALAIDKMNLELYLKLGDLLVSRGEREQAIATFQTALQIQPKNSVAIARLQSLSLRGGESFEGTVVEELPAPPAPQIVEFSPEDLKF